MATGLQGCVFCGIVHSKPSEHLKAAKNSVIIKERSPHAPYHYLILSKQHINKPTDLTPLDIDLVKEMDQLGREYLREVLKNKGEADTVDSMLRIGFHKPPFLSINHLHMHLLYPIHDIPFFYRTVVYRPGKFLRLAKTTIEELEKAKNPGGYTDMQKKLEGNPAIGDPKAPIEEDVHAVAVAN